jgi:transposase
MELGKEHYRSYVYIEMKRGKTAAEIHRQLQETADLQPPSQATVFRWYKKFQDGYTSLADEQRVGRPCSSTTSANVNRIKELLRDDPRQSLSMIAEQVGIGKETVREIVRDRLGFRKVCSVFVPHSLTPAEKRARVECAKQFLSLMEAHDPADLLRRWATEDETWVPFQGLLTKQEHKAWLPKEQPKLRIPRPVLTKKKALLVLAFTGSRNFHIEALHAGETLTSQRYIDFIHLAGEKWRVLHAAPTKLSTLLWQHDNASPHKATATQEFLQQRGMELVPQPAYSPDFNQCDRWLFADLKKHLRRMQFSSAEEIREESLRYLRSIPENHYAQELQNLKTHCRAVIQCKGDYVI